MPAISTSAETQAKRELVKDILQCEYNPHLNIDSLKNFLNAIYRVTPKNNKVLDFDMLNITKTAIKKGNFTTLVPVLDYFNDYLTSSQEKLSEDLIIKDIRGLNSKIRKLCVDAKIINDDFYKLIFSSIRLTENTIQYSVKPQQAISTFEYLYNEVKSFGNLILSLREKEYAYDTVESKVADLISNTQGNFSSFEEGKIKHAFLIQYHHGRKDIENICQQLFGTTKCYFPESPRAQFHAIVNGYYPSDTKNASAILNLLFADLEQPNVADNTNIPISNFLSYFLSYITTLNSKLEDIPEIFIDQLSLLINKLPEVFKEITPKEEVYNHLFSLVIAVLKNPHITTPKFFIFSPALDACKKLMKDLLQQQTNIDTLITSFADIYYQINKITWMTPDHKLEFAKDIGELSLICLNQKGFNFVLTLNNFSKVLGTIVRDIPLSNNITRTEIEHILPQVFENTSVRIPESELTNIAVTFLRQYSNETQIQEKCLSLFKLTDCVRSPNPIPSINHTTSTDIVKNNKTTHITSDIIKNSDSETPIQDNKYVPLASKIGTAMGLGGLTGFLDGSSQVILHIAERRNCSIGARRLLAVTLALSNSFAICTLPLIYSIVDDLANDKNDQTVNSQKIVTSIYAFLTSVGLQGINAGIHYFFPDKLTLKNIINFLPLFASMWMLANGEEGVAASFFILGTHILTSIGVKATVQTAGQKVYSFFNSTRNEKYLSEKKHTTEMKPLNVEKALIPVNGSIIDSDEKTYQFICLPELTEVKKLSHTVLEQLKKLIETFENDILVQKKQTEISNPPGILNALDKSIKDNSHILEIIKSQSNTVTVLHGELESDMHLKACEMYTAKQKKEFVGAMEKLGNVFKLMESNFKNVQGKLKEAIGYTNAASDSFSIEVKNQLTSLADVIIFPLSKVTLYKDRYSNADAVEKTEKRCKTEVNQGFFNAITAVNANPITTPMKRSHKVRASSDNRNTFAFSSGSDSDLRISTASSSDASEHSVTSGNSAYNPIDVQQKDPLLNGVPFRV